MISLISDQLSNAVMDSDRELEANANRLLQLNAYQAFAAVVCTCQNQVVSLTGKVSSYFLKQVAQEEMKQIRQVRKVRNHIVVTSPVTR